MNAESKLRQQASPGAASGAPPRAALLLLSGMLNPPSIWDAVIASMREQLDDSVQILVADVLTQSSIPDMADASWQRFGALPAETPCYVAGFSMGGYVAIEMLAHQQRPIREAWLISTSAQPESPESAPMREKAIANFRKDFEKSIQATARWGTFEKTPEQLEPLLQAMRQVGVETAIRQTQAIMQRRNLRERLGALDIPVHVICGENDRITPAALSRDLASIVPNAQLKLVAKAGHMLPFETPRLIAQSLCERIAT